MLALIKGTRGICVLAYPAVWKVNGAGPDSLIEQMAEDGMVGLAVEHPDHDAEQRACYSVLARRLGLVPTGASDCHGARYDFRLVARPPTPNTGRNSNNALTCRPPGTNLDRF